MHVLENAIHTLKILIKSNWQMKVTYVYETI